MIFIRGLSNSSKSALFGVILRQLHTREQSHTESMLLSAGVSFPCLTLKYRAFTVESHSVGETPTSYPYPTALFGVILLKLTPATSRDKYATSPRGCGLSCSSSKYRRFTFFNYRAGGIPAFRSYPTVPFGVILRQLHTRDLPRQVRHESSGVWSFLLFIQISPFYLFQS